ncbi:DUF4091 domain-containing protein, partial [candidate division KSB1 bacterium]|nr:DUF4091 domain-containing protein [candidate division KSB1 bacterium]
MKTRIILIIRIIFIYSIITNAQIDNFKYKLTQSTSSYQIWTTTPSDRVFKDASVPTETGSDVKVYIAKNEFEPCQIVVKPTSSGNITIAMGDFGSGITTELYQVKYVNITQTTDIMGRLGNYPDPLWPTPNGSSIAVVADSNTSFWISIFVPSTTPAGNYSANFTIAGINIPISLHVFDFTISDTLHVESQMNFSHNTILTKYSVAGTGADYWMYIDMMKQYFIDHRLTPRSVLWSGGLTSNGGAPYIDYDCAGHLSDPHGIWGFEKPAERYLNGTGLMNGTFTNPFNNGVGFTSFQAITFQNNDASADQRPSTFCSSTRSASDWYISDNPTSEYNQKWFSYITAIEHYLDSLGYLDKAYYYFANEPQDQADYDAVAWYSRYLGQAAPNLKLMVSENPRTEIFNHTNYVSDGQIDIWLPVLNQYDPTISFDRELNHGEVSWIYFLHGTRPPYFNPITLDHPGIESKFTGWFLWKYRIKGIAYYAINDWSKNPWTDPMTDGHNGDLFMLYPPSESNTNIAYGSNNHRMVPSIRFELMRDGFEDYEYLYILNNNSQPQVNVVNGSDSLANKIIAGLTSYTRDDNFNYTLRKFIGQKLGDEISEIPDITPPPTHQRAEETQGNYYINFQDPDGQPTTSFTRNEYDTTYKYYTFEGKDYLQIGTNNYNQKLGYGWYAPNDVNWIANYDQWFDNGNVLQKSKVYSDWGRRATFEFDLPNGQYNVAISIGARGTYNHQYVKVEGTDFFVDAATSNSCSIETEQVTITDNKLTLEMGAPSNNEYTMLNNMDIEAISTKINLDLKVYLQGAYRLEQNYPNPFNPET